MIDMTASGGPARAAEPPEHRFWLLLIALVALLIGYPYFENTRTGAFLGGVTALWALIGGVYAVRANRRTFGVALVLALATAAASARAFLGGVRGDAVVEATFSAFYAFMTVAPSSSRSSRSVGCPLTPSTARSASICSWA